VSRMSDDALSGPDTGIPGVTRRHRPADFYHERTNFQFIKHSRRWLYVSGSLMVIAILALTLRGLNLSIEFKGGSSWQVPVTGKSPSVPDVRNVLAPLHIGDAKVSVLSGQGTKSVRVEARVLNDPVQEFETELAGYAKVGEADVVLVRANSGNGGTFTVTSKNKAISEAGIAAIAKKHGVSGVKTTISGTDVTVTAATLPPSPVDAVTSTLAKYANASVRDVSVSTVGPTWGSDVSRKAIKALIIFFILLALYLTVRFEWKMSAAAILAVVHDVVFTVGFYALFQFPVSPATVTAFLTILGFSLYDTVVVFDKVRENQASLTAVGRSTYSDMVNRSLNNVLMRSLSTSFVALLPVASLLVIGSVIMGATTLEDFALALLVGLFIGSYSSIFVAAPVLAWWKEKEPQNRALRERLRRAEASGTTSPPLEAEVGVPVGAGARSRDARPASSSAVSRPAAPRPRQQRRRKRR
jgi:preprotein translocase subunit SecF